MATMGMKIKTTLRIFVLPQIGYQKYKKPKMTTSKGMDTGEAGNLFIGGGSTNWYNYYGNHCGGPLLQKKIYNQFNPMIQESHS